ncbi:MAG: outer membrane lipoprotein chaperone LolA [Psychromonas sp.]
MKKLSALLFTLLITLSSMAVNAASDAQLLKEKLAKFTIINAEFSQRVTSPEGKILNDSVGTLAISRPGKFRWEVTSPEEELIISDGETMWMYSPFIEQVTLLNLSDAIQGTPFILLSGANDAQWANYEVTKNNNQFKVTDISGSAQDRSFVFEFDIVGKVSKFVVIEEQGQRSEFTLRHKVPATAWKSSFFSFAIPNGVEIDDQR